MKGIITVDIGTTSMRAILYGAAGDTLFMDQRQNLPEFLCDGRVEQDPTTWQRCLIATLSRCREMASTRGITPQCISVTSQRSSFIPVDRQGVPLHSAIMWQDNRSASMAQAMDDSNVLVYGKTGLKISPVFSAIKMAWLRQNRPDIWRRTHKLIGVQDWALWVLTRPFVTDQRFGCRTK